VTRHQFLRTRTKMSSLMQRRGQDLYLGLSAGTRRSGTEFPTTLDHLFVEAAWRDVTPKMDLFKGHIGDGIPLCTDMPDRLFLRAGAQYRYLGG